MELYILIAKIITFAIAMYISTGIIMTLIETYFISNPTDRINININVVQPTILWTLFYALNQL